ncbi:alpha/beta fold hydrolase [Pedobacter sp. UBA5917]|jgi:pimeloyl-ACP methyl ester carboxylesterase|uniref:alpha/beta fold hydrolase n=1 Tax=Pedobacter sp. UBA5917 TaxID=1947061 RepID=UPI0025FCA007|nr:alpha/beta hydrolase [Pedobacter sp. UBA5917]
MDNTGGILVPNDRELALSLGSFESREVQVNDITLHYVEGGAGQPLIFLPGWPETWWSYHKIMPELAKHFRVISLDIRGMGNSSKPTSGYRKKEMASDVAELVKKLDLGKVHIAGHDIGAAVAYSFAAVYPELTSSLIIMDTPPVDESIYKLPMLPIPGMFYPWWLAFNQVDEIPEKVLEGRYSFILDSVFDGLSVQSDAINAFDRSVYARTYNIPTGIRAANGWYKAFVNDIEDNKYYQKINVPVLGIGGSGYHMIENSLPALTTDLKLCKIDNCGHFIQSEKPEELTVAIKEFLATIKD